MGDQRYVVVVVVVVLFYWCKSGRVFYDTGSPHLLSVSKICWQADWQTQHHLDTLIWSWHHTASVFVVFQLLVCTPGRMLAHVCVCVNCLFLLVFSTTERLLLTNSSSFHFQHDVLDTYRSTLSTKRGRGCIASVLLCLLALESVQLLTRAVQPSSLLCSCSARRQASSS